MEDIKKLKKLLLEISKGANNKQLSELKINPKNPQVFGDLEKLENSIIEFPKMMELRPMVYDPATKEVLGGNKRLICLQELKFKEIPESWAVSAGKLTDKEKKRFILADNIGFGEWDFEMLDVDFMEFDLEDLGIEIPDIDLSDSEERSVADDEKEDETINCPKCNFEFKK